MRRERRKVFPLRGCIIKEEINTIMNIGLITGWTVPSR